MTNRFQGLHRGPIDHKSSSIINLISNGVIDMGSAVAVTPTILSGEILPRVEEIDILGSNLIYGIAVGGEVDGVYGDGSASVDDSTRATNGPDQRVVVLTQGRCPARVGDFAGGLLPGDSLIQSNTLGLLEKGGVGEDKVAIALNSIFPVALDIIAIDFQRKGVGPI